MGWLGVDSSVRGRSTSSFFYSVITGFLSNWSHKIRELVEELKVKPEFVPTDENAADMMTKPLGRAKFEKFRRFVLNHGA